jgi:hypothetical protein
MKQLLLAAALAISSVGFGQSGIKEDIDIIQSAWGKTKQELIDSSMKLKEPQAAAFWKIYDAYEAERKTLGATRLRLINDYTINYETLTEAKADELAKATLKNNLDYEKLYSKYYDKVKKATGAINAAKFIQLETALQTAIRSETQDAIPFIGEIDRTKKQ